MTSCLAEASGDILRSIVIAGAATLMATPFSVALAAYIALREARLVERVIDSLVGVPTVLIGLLLYALLCHRCPFGWSGLLYTPQAIAIGEAILVLPVYTAVLSKGFEERVRKYYELALGLGAKRSTALIFSLRESLPTLVSGALAAYSRAVGELGVAMLIGGGIAGYTRTATVAIALEVARGEFECAITIGLFLTAVLAVVSVASLLLERV